MSVGRARRCLTMRCNTRLNANNLASKLENFQEGGFKLADMITEIDAADWLTLSAWRLDEGLEANREIASAKVYASEVLARVTDEAIQIYGGGMIDE